MKKTNPKATFTCHHGKGTVSVEGSCTQRNKRNMCKNGHPCKRVK